MKSGSNGDRDVGALWSRGCNSAGSIMWVPQGSGEVRQKSARVRRHPRRAGRRPRSRKRIRARANQSPSAIRRPYPRRPRGPPRLQLHRPGRSRLRGLYAGDALRLSAVRLRPDRHRPAHQPDDRDKVEDQTRQVMENSPRILESHRLTMANVVSVTVI